METIRVSGLVLTAIAIWVLDWVLYITIKPDTGWLAAPYVTFTFVMLAVLGQKKKENEYHVWYSTMVVSVLVLGYFVLCVVALYYSPIFTLLWNLNGLAAVLAAYYVSTGYKNRPRIDASLPAS